MVTAAIQGGLAALNMGIGIFQKMKAAKMARNNIRPELKDNTYTDQAYGLTGELAGQGLSDASRAAFTTNNDRNVSAGIDAVLKGGGSMNNIGNVIDAGGSVLREMTLADQEMRARNQRNFLESIKSKADEERDKFFVNQMAPFQDKAAAIAQLNGQGAANINSGINGLGAAAIGAFGGNPYASGGGNNSAVASSPALPDVSGAAYTGGTNLPGMAYASPASTFGRAPSPAAGVPGAMTTAEQLNRYLFPQQKI